jgi:hypothetical protein
MTDLEQAVRDGLRSLPALPLAIDDRVVELRARVKRRRARRRVGATAAVVVAAVAIVNANTNTTTTGRPARVRDAVVASVGTSPVLAPPAAAPTLDPGPLLHPDEVLVSPEGVAVEVDGVGVVLVGLDGQVFGHLPDFAFGFSEAAGPLQLRTRYGDEYYVLDDGTVVPSASVDGWTAWPLAYGAEAVTVVDRAPGGTVVRRNGRQLFDLGNQMASSAKVANDRDVVSITRLDTEVSEALDLRSGRRWPLPYGCLVGDRHGSRRYLLCGEGTTQTPSIRAGKDTDPSPGIAFGPVDGDGRWVEAMVSPDGRQLLLGWWSNSCHGVQAYLAPSAGGDLAPVERWLGRDLRGTAIRPLGWTLDGRAIVEVMAPGPCGEPAAAPGVYALSAGSSVQVVAIPGGNDYRNAELWAPALR